MRGRYQEANVVSNLTANGDYPANHILIGGARSIALYGTFDGAVLQIVLFTERPDGTLEELPISTDLTYTAAEAPAVYQFPQDMPAKIRIGSAGLNTDVSVNIHRV